MERAKYIKSRKKLLLSFERVNTLFRRVEWRRKD